MSARATPWQNAAQGNALGIGSTQMCAALKGHKKLGRRFEQKNRADSSALIRACVSSVGRVPRASPWAKILRPCRGGEIARGQPETLEAQRMASAAFALSLEDVVNAQKELEEWRNGRWQSAQGEALLEGHPHMS